MFSIRNPVFRVCPVFPVICVTLEPQPLRATSKTHKKTPILFFRFTTFYHSPPYLYGVHTGLCRRACNFFALVLYIIEMYFYRKQLENAMRKRVPAPPPAREWRSPAVSRLRKSVEKFTFEHRAERSRPRRPAALRLWSARFFEAGIRVVPRKLGFRPFFGGEGFFYTCPWRQHQTYPNSQKECRT